MSRILATIAALGAGLSLAAAPAARAVELEPPAPARAAAPADALASDWLGAPVLPMPSEAPTCRADDPAARAARAGTAARLERIKALMAADAAAPGDPGDVVVLNNRGYNYGAGAAALDPSLLEFEAKRAR